MNLAIRELSNKLLDKGIDIKLNCKAEVPLRGVGSIRRYVALDLAIFHSDILIAAVVSKRPKASGDMSLRDLKLRALSVPIYHLVSQDKTQKVFHKITNLIGNKKLATNNTQLTDLSE